MSKPSFKKLYMNEVNAKSGTNGYNVVSTFTGAGGSCIGLKLAGFNILYAVEFIPKAQEVYKLNHPKTFLDKRDIRIIKGEEILNQCNLNEGELDLLEGSPPCAGFSNLGARDKTWNSIKKYSNAYQRVDDLFFEFIRLTNEIKPKMILCENVPGLCQGISKGYLKLFVNKFKEIGYDIEIRIVDSSLLNVPQKRKRLIIIGKRNDLNINIVFPKPKNYIYNIEDAIPNFKNNIPKEEYSQLGDRAVKLQKRFDYCRKHHLANFSLASEILDNKKSGFAYKVEFEGKPASTIIQKTPLYHGYQNRSLSIDEGKRLHTFPEDFKLTGSFNQKWERIGRSVPPKMYEAIGLSIKKSLDDYYGKSR